jgi:hypothetical protein
MRGLSHEKVSSTRPFSIFSSSVNISFRVRCDLKDLPLSASGSCPTCSNCKERGLKCMYDQPCFFFLPRLTPNFSQRRICPSKSCQAPQTGSATAGSRVRRSMILALFFLSDKSRRQGYFGTLFFLFLRRAADRAIYGKTAEGEDSPSLPSLRSQQPSPSTIPHLKPEFFSSHFWHRFCTHRQFC